MSQIYKIGINGFGRIGRLAFRLILQRDDLEVVAINDVVDAKVLCHLLKYDSAHGPLTCCWDISVTADDVLECKNKCTGVVKKAKIFNILKTQTYKWGEMSVNCVLECSGRNLTEEAVQVHLKAGAEKVVISAPASDKTKTIVYNVNHKSITKSDTVVSAASCTTNALAPVVHALQQEFGIDSGFMTTVHAYTADQRLQDSPHSDLRRSRAASYSIIPTSTGAAAAIGKVIPELQGKLDGVAHRVPVLTGSLVDFLVKLKKTATAEEINAAIKKHSSETLCYCVDPIVSADIISHTAGSIFDSLLTKVLPTGEVKLYMWYDNESSYANQLIRTLAYFVAL